MIKYLIIYIAILLTSNLCAQETKFDSLIQKGIKEIYSLKFDEAESTFVKLQRDYPAHPAGKFFDAMTVWWKVLLDLNDEQYDDLFYDKLDEVIDFCDDILDENENDQDALFFKGGAIGFRGRLRSIRKDWFDAAADGKEALPLVFKAYDIDSTNIDLKLGFGIYNYYAAAVPEKYPAVKPLMFFFPEGDKKKGIEYLEYTAEKGKYTSIESKYFLMNLYFNFENNYSKALIWAKILHEEFPENPVFQRYVGRIYIRLYGYPEASEIFKNIYKRCREGKIGYNKRVEREALYYIGVNYFNEDRIDSSLTYFSKCDSVANKIEEDENGFVVNTALYLGMLNDLSENRETAILYYEKVLDYDDFRDSHEKAERYLENPYRK